MSKKLIYKTQQIYLVFSIATFLLVAPVFYFVTEKLYLNDADEYVHLQKSEFLNNTVSTLKETDIALWNRFNVDIQINAYSGLAQDTLYTTAYFNAIENEHEPFRELDVPIQIEGKPYTLSVRVNLLESEDLMVSIALLFLSLFLLLFLGLFLITKYRSLQLWKPFYKTLAQMEEYEIDKNKWPSFSDSNIEEFNTLNTHLKRLMERNTRIFQSQKEFIENAAHELQTPIAIFKAKIDTLIQHSDLTEEQSAEFNSLNKTIERLNRLNKNLLLLSKLESTQTKEKKQFSLKELFENRLEFFVEQANQKNIQIESSLNNDILLVANSESTEVLLNNLLMNAIRHNKENGRIEISINNRTFTISNTGKNKPLPDEKIFTRFSKTDSSKEGTGLGLAIVKKIADLNNWQISYTFNANFHRFSVRF